MMGAWAGNWFEPGNRTGEACGSGVPDGVGNSSVVVLTEGACGSQTPFCPASIQAGRRIITAAIIDFIPDDERNDHSRSLESQRSTTALPATSPPCFLPSPNDDQSIEVFRHNSVQRPVMMNQTFDVCDCEFVAPDMQKSRISTCGQKSGMGVSPVYGETENTGETPVPLFQTVLKNFPSITKVSHWMRFADSPIVLHHSPSYPCNLASA